MAILRPLSLSELLDRTFSLFRQNFVLFAGIAALPNLLLFAVQLTNLVLQRPGVFSLGALLTNLVTICAAFLALTMVQAATVMAVSHLYLDRPITIAESYRLISGEVLGLMGLVIIVGLLTGLGLILLIVPGIYLMLRFSLAVPVAVLERNGLSAMSRSGDLTSGDKGRIFLVYLLYFIAAAVFSAVWNVPFMIGIVIAHGDPLALPLWTKILVQVGSFVTQCLVAPLLTIALSLLYYDERVRKEGFDLEHMMATIDGLAPAGV